MRQSRSFAMASSPTTLRARPHVIVRLLATLLTVCLAVAVLTACGGDATEEQTPEPGLANPASEHCEEQGGQVDIRQDADGAEQGVCVFPDGSECEEWAYFRGECEPDGTGG
jgi:putative hemolysin